MNNGPPYLLALVFGLLVSATLYMLFVWPKIEPEDQDEEDEPRPKAASDEPSKP